MTRGYKTEYYPGDIADAFCELLKIDNSTTKEQLEDALYQLKAIVENPYNSQFYTTLYMVLESLTYRVGTGEVRTR